MIEIDFVFTPGVLKFSNNDHFLFMAEVLLEWAT